MLPEEVFVHVLTFCTPSQLLDISLCSKHEYRIIHDESTPITNFIWQQLFKSYSPHNSTNDKSWKKLVRDFVTWKWTLEQFYHDQQADILSENNKTLTNNTNTYWITGYCEATPIRNQTKVWTWELVINNILYTANYYGIAIGVGPKTSHNQVIGSFHGFSILLCNGYMLTPQEQIHFFPGADEESCYCYLPESNRFKRGDVIGVKFTCLDNASTEIEYFLNGDSILKRTSEDKMCKAPTCIDNEVMYLAISLINHASLTLRVPALKY
jgi:hypothetical protein